MSLPEYQFEAALGRLQLACGYSFADLTLLRRALTHKSFANELDGAQGDNERLEFLGDAVMELVVSHLLFDRFPQMQEGELTQARSAIVCTPSLAEATRQVGLDEAVRLGRGENSTGGRKKSSLLADAFEALIGAAYLDGGLAAVRTIVAKVLGELLENPERLVDRHPKNNLQEFVQARGMPLPSYHATLVEGPDHEPCFEVEVRCGNEAISRARGSSKRLAAREAARLALELLARELPNP